MKRKGLSFIGLVAVALTIGTIFSYSSQALPSCAASNSVEIDYSPEKWHDTGTLWSVDETSRSFLFDVENTGAQAFTANFFLSDQFDTVDATITSVSAKFKATTSSADILSQTKTEVHIGIIPWYLDNNNWVIIYPKFSRCDDVAIKDGHIFDCQCYVKLNGSTHVEYYVREEGNVWVAANDPNNSEWHSGWPDRVNTNMSPTSLQDTEPDPSSENTVAVTKTRKTFAGKEVDSFYFTVNNYELNFACDNFNFSGLIEAEKENPELKPQIGFYAFNTNKLIVSDMTVSISHEKILPLPTVSPLTTPVKTGSVGKKVSVPDFIAYANSGDLLETKVSVVDPEGNAMYLESATSFSPTSAGDYTVIAAAEDSEGLVGNYTYTVRIKTGTNHMDNNAYNDIYTPEPYDNSINIAYGIFISIPIVIAVWIGLKVFFDIRKKKKEKRALNDDE